MGLNEDDTFNKLRRVPFEQIPDHIRNYILPHVSMTGFPRGDYTNIAKTNWDNLLNECGWQKEDWITENDAYIYKHRGNIVG